MTEPLTLTRVDSAVQGLSPTSPKEEKMTLPKEEKTAPPKGKKISPPQEKISHRKTDSSAADASDIQPLTRVDSAIEGLSPISPVEDKIIPPKGSKGKKISPPKEKVSHRKPSSSAADAPDIQPLTRVDSAVEGLSPISPVEDKISHRRTSSSVGGVVTMKDLKDNDIEVEIARESQGTGWKINTSIMSVEDKEILKKPLITPLVRAVDLHFQHGVVVTARNRKGVTIKDALTAIHDKNKKRADDEIEKPYLKGFEWLPNHPQLRNDPEKQDERKDEWERLYIHLSATPDASGFGGSKKKKKNNADAA
ncbi:hypothetical protein F4804DRAFT_336319 [Jackrogersella minutella]|nr:hypothetical protein F4804DRAFT_336319 [Jackrogersella minutella]